VECVKIYLDSRVKWRAICGGKKIRGDDIWYAAGLPRKGL
jgi:hypothetical protein